MTGKLDVEELMRFKWKIHPTHALPDQNLTVATATQ